MSEVEYPNNLASYREKRGLTVTEIAVEMGLSHSTVYTWEDGRRMPRNKRIMLPIIEKAYGATRQELWPLLYGQS